MQLGLAVRGKPSVYMVKYTQPLFKNCLVMIHQDESLFFFHIPAIPPAQPIAPT